MLIKIDIYRNRLKEAGVDKATKIQYGIKTKMFQQLNKKNITHCPGLDANSGPMAPGQ